MVYSINHGTFYRRIHQGPLTSPSILYNLQLQIGVCQYPREYLTFVYIKAYNNHTLSNFVQLKIFGRYGEKF